MEDHFFRDLHPQLSTKEYKFQQRKSAPNGSEGECLAVCLMWIKEKISSSRFSWFRTSDFSAGENEKHTHNFEIMQRARSLGGHGSFSQIQIIENNLGLQHQIGNPAAFMNRRASQGLDLLQSLVALVAELQPGTAACARLRIANPEGGHSIAMYRSRSGHLHFFDPNVGIYKVNHPTNFIMVWLQGCRSRGWDRMTPDVRTDLAQTTWCQLYPRR